MSAITEYDGARNAHVRAEIHVIAQLRNSFWPASEHNARVQRAIGPGDHTGRDDNANGMRQAKSRPESGLIGDVGSGD
jgi:hypothetical protein